MIRLVLFDIDGTLIRTRGAGVEAFARTFASVFGVHGAAERVHFAGRTDFSLVRELFALSGVRASKENFQRFFDAYIHHLRDLMRGCRGEICPGVTGFIRDLEKLSPPPLIGLLTGNIHAGAEIKLRHFKLWELFRTGAFADDHEDRNEIAVVARERGRRALDVNLRGDEILVVGDTAHDIRCARAIGAKVLAVATGGHTLAELKKHAPDWAVKDLRTITAREVCG
ncbi:MAG: HAD hydrolase-like protein [Verrucomicrobia bacterium]|jgi:phosphoglycolate phosphatase-like HAD superfamily hydrolase|nr:HAD hydrolase-like protein [Verrucomicrobiota bacterium]